MLHRMAMRIVPALTVAVTEEEVRRRKRIVMLFPGLIAFALYRGLQAVAWHDNIVFLLLTSGLFSGLVALAAYACGRERGMRDLIREDGAFSLTWMALRIGFLYSVQLSLMVLALLKVATYNYLQHPDGPAMMALIIAATSVSRDAFEIGHLRLLQQQGRPFVMFPNGKGLRALIAGGVDLWAGKAMSAAVAVGLAYFGLAVAVPSVTTDWGHLAAVGLLVGLFCTLAFVQGLQPAMTVWEGLARYSWQELLKFFVWPGMAFGWTYYLIALGVLSFLMDIPNPPLWGRVLLTAVIGGLMSLYGYYLGRSRWQEEKLHATISPSLLRCPFIQGILTSKKASP